MSGPSKRIHEEGGHPTPLKRPYEEAGIFSTPGKLNQTVTNDFHLPVEHGPEGRSAKVQRIDAREFDKRPSQLHRVSTSSTNSTDQQAASENRLELKSSKDVRDIKSETQEVKQDVRGMYTCTKIDLQISKADNDVRMEPRVDEKELRTDRSSHIDFRGDIKFEKDNYSVAGSHSTWRDTKENNRNKKFYEPVNDGSDSWRIARDAQQSISEVPKDLSIVKERVPNETHEAVGENKIDVKGEKFRDKDRKRSREFGEKDKDRNDRRNNVQLGGPNIDSKELREERDVDKWERDRKDVQEDKEHYDREKDSVKRELPNANEKESQHHEKESADGSVRITEQENTTGESKKQKDDGWKPSDRDIKEKKRERDLDLGDRHEQRSKPGEKESDDLCAEGDGIAEKDKEAFGGVQQRKRMSRTRGNPQTPHREPRFRCRARDNDGSQGKQESSMLVYKAGECMQEILKSWKEHEASQDNKNDESLQDGPILEIRILAEYVTSTNRQVKGAQLWGTDIYTNDSDLVAVLMHTGYCCPTSTPPPSAIQELRATIRVLPPKDCYTSSLRNNVRSRAWGAGIGCSYCVERCCIVKKGGGTIDLEPRLTHTSAVEPTLAPVSVERTMTTRAAASNALRQQRFVREVTIQYNLCNEPWLKYTLGLVADKGLKKPLYTSARLKKGEVLYLETRVNRYELCFNGEKPLSTSSHVHEMEHDKHQNHSSHVQNGDRHSSDRENIRDAFRWSRCKKAFPEKTMRSLGIPLPLEQLEVLEDNLDWEDVQWSQNAVWVAGKEYPLVRAHFLSPN